MSQRSSWGSATEVRRALARLTLSLGVLAAAACASAAPGAEGGAGAATSQTSPAAVWPIKTREHIDLWLHGYAMLIDDTTKVPYFERGYRDRMVVLKNQNAITSQLDADRETLRRRFTQNRQLISTQFVALYFNSWDDMQQVISLFLQAGGDVSRVSQQVQPYVGLLASNFPSAADRDWLQLFVRTLADESARFYHGYWVGEQRSRERVLAEIDTVWQRTYRPKLQRFLNNTQQESGDFFLSLPLDGEGRTITLGSRQNVIATSFPGTNAVEAIYVFAHEASGAVVNVAVSDNITPAEQRAGYGDRYAAAGLVIGGAMLLEKVAPELVDGYSRYYLRSAGVTPRSDARAHLTTEFPLPTLITDAIKRQVEIVMGGI
jgi:hypothetical protein